MIEQLEASNEAAQALNEEIQTTNEELQSTNQELEAANEELQASNEELSTVNEDLLAKSAEWQAMAAELEGIYATMDCALLAFDNRLVLTRLNRAAQVHLGIDPAWLGTPLASLPWPDGMPSLQTELDLLQQHGRPQTRQITGMGARHWTLRLLPRLGADGARIGVLLQLEDHTRLRDSEEAALRSDARMRQLVQRSTQLVCICDPAGRLLLANPEFERYHRLAGGGAGRLLVELLPAEQAQTFRNAHLEVLRTLGGLEVEEQADLDGSPRDLLATYFPLLDDDGAVSAVCYQALDITRRKQAESDLLAAQSAKLAAEGMARTKASFLANMSHEIRTPMNAVLGLSRMALQEPLTPRAHEQIAHIHEAAHALTRILDDVLDFSKIEAGELQFEQAPFRLDDLLREVRSLFSANAQQKGLALVLDRPLGVPEELVGDSLRLAQVLNNLVGNAIKFTEAGEVRLSVGPLPSPAPGRCRLRFSVRDTGIGVAPGLQDKLFEAFTQGDASVTRRFGGTGLGLAICQRLVALMRGEIGVLSEAGRGSEFWFSAEFALSAAPERAAAADPATPHALADWAGRRVLLAEDNELNQIVGRAVLEQLGLQVEVAAHGAELLDRLSRQPVGHYSAVLMDVHMPVLDGLEATRRLRRLPQGRAIPVIALTAAALSEDRDRCLAAGMDDHIAKPLDPGRLIEALRAVQPERGVRVRPPAPADDPPQVPGFDLQPLFERLQHNRRMVWQLLEEFVEREGVTGDELRRLLSESRVDEARLRVHGLLGSAVTVGATLVSRTAAGLEAALGAGLVSPAMMQSVDEALSMNLAAVREALALRPPADR